MMNQRTVIRSAPQALRRARRKLRNALERAVVQRADFAITADAVAHHPKAAEAAHVAELLRSLLSDAVDLLDHLDIEGSTRT